MKKYVDFDSLQALFNEACAECRDTCEEYDGFYADCDQCTLHDIIEKAKLIPSADVAPVRHGHWIFDDFDGDGYDYQCSYCGTYSKKDGKYCDNCGAIMEGISV